MKVRWNPRLVYVTIAIICLSSVTSLVGNLPPNPISVNGGQPIVVSLVVLVILGGLGLVFLWMSLPSKLRWTDDRIEETTVISGRTVHLWSELEKIEERDDDQTLVFRKDGKEYTS